MPQERSTAPQANRHIDADDRGRPPSGQVVVVAVVAAEGAIQQADRVDVTGVHADDRLTLQPYESQTLVPYRVTINSDGRTLRNHGVLAT